MRGFKDRAQRGLVLVVAVAIGSASLSWWLARGIESPAEAARHAQAPAASVITVPVEKRVIATNVVVRGDVAYAEAVAVTVDGDLGDGTLGATTVTGRVPIEGSEVQDGSVLIEVSGRPVFVLSGSLPMYRGLRPGMSGADVRQLEQALKRLGWFNRSPDNTYDSTTANAVSRFYAAAGYSAIGPSTAEKREIAAAENSVKQAKQQQTAATLALMAAQAGPLASEVIAAQGAVDQAQRDYDAAQANLADARATGADAAMIRKLEGDVESAANALAVAQARFDELLAPADSSALVAALGEATSDRHEAEKVLADLTATIGVRVPRGEIVFVPTLPRRVQKVAAVVGKPLSGEFVRLAGADVQIDASVSLEEQKLLKPGMEVRLDDVASAVDLGAVVAVVADQPGTDGVAPGSYYVRVTPTESVDPAKVIGLNLRVTIPITSTGGEVLAVPLAALVTDASGKVTVRVAATGSYRDVAVTVGLAADGFAQVTPVDNALDAGDLVVVAENS